LSGYLSGSYNAVWGSFYNNAKDFKVDVKTQFQLKKQNKTNKQKKLKDYSQLACMFAPV